MCDLLLYIVYHDDVSKEVAMKYAKYPWARLLFIPSTKYLESITFKMLQKHTTEWKDKKYVGVLKYSFEGKTPFYDFESLCRNASYDLFTFVGPNHHAESSQQSSMIRTAVGYHPLFATIWSHLLVASCKIDGSDAFSNDIPAFYSNYWIAKVEFFEGYIQFFDRIYTLMENDPNAKYLLEQNSCYTEPHIPEEKLLKIMGAPFYKYYPFILERLPCFFFWKVGATIHLVRENDKVPIL